MRFDICCCTYRSEKWLDGFFAAIEKMEYDKKQIGIYFVDNDSPDGTVAALEKHQRRLAEQFADFKVAQMGCNAGFGRSSNRAAAMGSGELVLFLNVDTAIFPDALTEMEQAVRAAASEVAAFEMRQYPYEHPKYYDPVTRETPWASGAALAVRRSVLEQLGGFDESIFMYCEDVELSWRLRTAGYRLQYVPRAGLMHYAAEKSGMLENAGQLAGEKMLRLKYGDSEQLAGWDTLRDQYRQLWLTEPEAQALADRLVADTDRHAREYRRFYRRTVRRSGFVPDFRRGFADLRQGGRYACTPVRQDGRITVIVRAYRRPAVLRLTLECLAQQTCRDFRVLLVEDGETPVCGDVAAAYADRLQLDYLPLHRQAGRCAAGNAGLAAVKTPYAVFLDDDDYFFADYIETVAAAITAHPDCGMFCSRSLAAETRAENADGSDYEFVRLLEMPNVPITRAHIWYDNPVPIQAVVFDMALYRQYGGFDEALDAFEDWDFWMRCAQTAKICTVEKTLSVFRIPADAEETWRRTSRMDTVRAAVYEKSAAYRAKFSAQELRSLWQSPEPPADDVSQLKASARALLASPVRRAAAPLRTVLYALSDFFGRQAAFFGPEDVAPETASVKELQRFVRKARSCGWLRLVTKLTRKGKS